MHYRLIAASLAAALGGTGMVAHAAEPAATTLSGKMYFDFTRIDQKSRDSGSTDASGSGLDVKRFYLQVDHALDDVWSATLVTDFNYVASDGETNLFVKKAYVQGKFNRAAVSRVGSADMPWIPFAENYYGFRYVENTLVDRLKFGNSADWGLHMGGDVGAGGRLNYAVSAVNGAGYRNPGRSRHVDVEGRVGFVPVEGMAVALGAYAGTRGLETENTDALHTARRSDLMVAYAHGRLRVGGEYFRARDWGNVLTPAGDAASGWSAWASAGVNGAVTVFARYDRASLSKDLDPGARDTYYNAGVEFQVNRGLKLAAVYKHEARDATVRAPLPGHVDRLTTNEIGVWGEVKF